METPICSTREAPVVCCGDPDDVRSCGLENLLSDFPSARVISHEEMLSDAPPLRDVRLVIVLLAGHASHTFPDQRSGQHSNHDLPGRSSEELRHSISAVVNEAAYPGMAVLRYLRSLPNPPTVALLTRQGTPLEICCAAVECGVSALVEMDSSGWQKRLSAVLLKSMKRAATQQKQTTPLELLDRVGIMAISPAMQNLIVQAYRAAQVSDATVLIHGESGTGKQLLAEAIHRLDPKRGSNMFVPVNCAAITGTLAESELFGHARGAFSGATGNRAGYFKSAHKGTIMLDEVSELPMALQPKLLRVLQEGRVLAVGADREEPIDVRVIAASNISLAEKVANGTFRLDLYQRLNVIHLQIPPLRQRLEDMPLLIQHFLKKYRHYSNVEITSVDPKVIELLKRRMGNGNVRELENIVRQILVFKESGSCVELSDLPKSLLLKADEPVEHDSIPTVVIDHMVNLIRDGRLTLRAAIDAFEKTIIQRALAANPQLTKSQIAQTLGLPRRTLYHKLDAGGTKIIATTTHPPQGT